MTVCGEDGDHGRVVLLFHDAHPVVFLVVVVVVVAHHGCVVCCLVAGVGVMLWHVVLFLRLCIVLLLVLVICVCGGGLGAAMVTCGSMVKLKHVPTGFRLHSHEIPYGNGNGGSGQQSVTAHSGTHWQLEDTHTHTCVCVCLGMCLQEAHAIVPLQTLCGIHWPVPPVVQ